MCWQWKQFHDLTVDELYAIFILRQSVFIVEQNCVYPDIDKIDKVAWHCMGYNGGVLSAYSRVIPPNSQQQVAIGRLLTNQDHRRRGLGKLVLEQSLKFIQKTYPELEIIISAQDHLQTFYGEFGFIKTSEPYDEDGITHIDMLKKD